MRTMISASIELILFMLYLLWSGKHFSERIVEPGVLWIIGITMGIAIAASKVVEILIDRRLSKNEPQSIKHVNRWVLCFTLSSLIFFVAFNALEYFGNMPATIKLLIILSAGSAFCHLSISHVIDAFVGINRGSSKMIFLENDLEDDDVVITFDERGNDNEEKTEE